MEKLLVTYPNLPETKVVEEDNLAATLFPTYEMEEEDSRLEGSKIGRMSLESNLEPESESKLSPDDKTKLMNYGTQDTKNATNESHNYFEAKFVHGECECMNL